MKPLGDKVFCEVAGAQYKVLAVGPHVTTVQVGDLVVFDKSAILHTRTPKAPKVFVSVTDILGIVS